MPCLVALFRCSAGLAALSELSRCPVQIIIFSLLSFLSSTVSCSVCLSLCCLLPFLSLLIPCLCLLCLPLSSVVSYNCLDTPRALLLVCLSCLIVDGLLQMWLQVSNQTTSVSRLSSVSSLYKSPFLMNSPSRLSSVSHQVLSRLAIVSTQSSSPYIWPRSTDRIWFDTIPCISCINKQALYHLYHIWISRNLVLIVITRNLVLGT